MNIISQLLISLKVSIFGMELINYKDFISLVFHFLMNLAVVIVLTRWLYYQGSRRKDYLFTFIIISSITFLLCYMLENVKLEIGFALGLFAIFGIIRYRTNAIPIKEMTYLFLVIGISVINSLVSGSTSIAEIIFTNLAIIAIVYSYEKIHLLKHESSKSIIYEKINLIQPENYNELLEDLKKRTGIKKINRVEIGPIDFLKDICKMTLYCEEPEYTINLTDQATGNVIDDD